MSNASEAAAEEAASIVVSEVVAPKTQVSHPEAVAVGPTRSEASGLEGPQGSGELS